MNYSYKTKLLEQYKKIGSSIPKFITERNGKDNDWKCSIFLDDIELITRYTYDTTKEYIEDEVARELFIDNIYKNLENLLNI